MCKPTDRRSGSGRHGPYYFLPAQLERIIFIPQEVQSVGSSWTERKSYRMVHHDYHDHGKDNCDGLDCDLPKRVPKGGVVHQFPVQLHEILDSIEEDGHGDVISWQPHGRCFLVHKPKVFLKEIMPRYFRQRKFASFQRQLNLYQFQRLTTGRDKGGYYHELFLRNKPALAQSIKRQRIKGTGVRPRSNPDEEPDFYTMPSCFDENDVPDAEICCLLKEEKDVPMEVTSSEEKSRSSSELSAPLMDAMDEDEDEEMPRSPSPAVVDHRTAKQKLCSSFQPEPMTTSNVVPFILTSCCKSEIHQPESSDDDDDADVVTFEGKSFHYLNPSAPPQHRIVRNATPEVEEPELEEGLVDKQLNAILGELGEPPSNLDSMDELAFGTILQNLVLQRS